MKSNKRSAKYSVPVRAVKWLSTTVFELRLEKPPGFSFQAGQKISCTIDECTREYSLAVSPRQKDLALCIRHIPDGSVSSRLATLEAGDVVAISDPYGFFFYRPGKNRAVFVATGTGIAPFASYAASGIEGYVMLHGVARADELYYKELLQKGSVRYVPCLSAEKDSVVKQLAGFRGYVTTYLREHLQKGAYDFYLCGNGAMIRDMLAVIDTRFPDARVFTETFYTSE